MFALIDCNNFYASCERVFKPKLNNCPIVILSNNDGCVIARSNESKALGIPMGAPAYKFMEVFKQKNIHIFSSNFTLYADMSSRVMSSLAEFSPDIEIYSIDECFMKLSNFEGTNLIDYGKQMKESIYKKTKIPISIGIAPTKALAKVANKIAKKFPERTSGVFKINDDDSIIKALKWTKIDDVWGIGKRLAERLKAIDVRNAHQFTLLPENFVRTEFSIVELRLQKELKGESVLELEIPQSKKAIATTRSFQHDLNNIEEIQERISTFAVCCAKKLRQQNSYCNLVHVFTKTNKFKNKQAHHLSTTIELPYPSNSNITISKYALIGLKKIYDKRLSYKKAGVIIMGITPNTTKQTNLFLNENPKHEKLMQALDSINTHNGYDAVKLASQNIKKTWIMRREHLSQRYTTNWNEILEVS